MSDIYQALARTALLVELDIFGPGADHRAIIDGLRGTTARIITDRANIDTPAGQTALVTLYAQLAMQGLQIDLDVPATQIRASQPPLRGTSLPAALLDYSADLLPGGSDRPAAAPDVTFALGDTPAPPHTIRVTGTDWTAAAGMATPGRRWRGDGPAGAMAAAAAAAPEGLRAAIPRIAEHLGRAAPRDSRWRTHPGRHAALDLTRYQVDEPVAAGEVDVVSGGAITSAALYALLRTPAVTASLRIIDADVLTLPNCNRYALARRSMLDSPKVHALAACATSSITITGHQHRLDDTTTMQLGPLAPRLLVGVDHIPSRWAAQRAAPGSWICVGASSHDYVLVSAHPPGAACAGCVHTRDDQTPGDIPTISFVSFWAGFIQALELLASTSGRSPASARSTHLWPFGLENPRGIHHFAQAPVVRCPAGCHASTARRPA